MRPRTVTAPGRRRDLRKRRARGTLRRPSPVDEHGAPVRKNERRDHVIAGAPVVDPVVDEYLLLRVEAAGRDDRPIAQARSSPDSASASSATGRLHDAASNCARSACLCRASGRCCHCPAETNSATATIVATVGSGRGRNRRGAALRVVHGEVWLERACLHWPRPAETPMKIIIVARPDRHRRRAVLGAGTISIATRPAAPRMVRALAIRVALSASLVAFLVISYRMGWIAADRTHAMQDEKAARLRAAFPPSSAPRVRSEPVDEDEQQQPDDVDEVPVPRRRLEREMVIGVKWPRMTRAQHHRQHDRADRHVEAVEARSA